MKTQFFSAFILLLLSCLLPQSVQAQGPGDDLQAMRIAFITKKLNLTPDEAKVFWPVYDQYQAEQKKIRGEMRLERVDARENFELMSDKEVVDMMDRMLVLRQQELDLDKRYRDEFLKILSPRKTAMLFIAEVQFKKILIEHLQNRPQRPPGGGARGQGGARPGNAPAEPAPASR